MLRSSEEALELVRDPLDEVVSDIDLPRLADSNSSSFESAGQLVFDHADLAARNGDPEPVVKLLKKLVAPTNQNEWQLQYLYRQKANKSFDTIIKNLEQGAAYEGDDFRTLAEGFRNVVQKSVNYRPNNFYKAHLINVVAHVRAGETEAYLEWIKKLADNEKQTIRNEGGDANQWQIATSHLETGTNETLQQRIDTVIGLIKMSDASGWINLTSANNIKLRARGREHNFKPF